MDYFLPSFVQKRLLRYALSRLELVDSEAIDLDSLGIRWGQRSTFELRELGLRLDVSRPPFARKKYYPNGRISCANTSQSRTETHLDPPVTGNMQATESTSFTHTSHDTGRHLQQRDNYRSRRCGCADTAVV